MARPLGIPDALPRAARRPAPRRLHHQQHREPQPPGPQGDQDPRTLPRRASRHQADLPRDQARRDRLEATLPLAKRPQIPQDPLRRPTPRLTHQPVPTSHTEGRTVSWTLKHRHWLSQQRFDDAPSRVTYADYLHARDVLLGRRELVARELEQIAPSCVWGETIARLRCLRGINTLTALGLCAEIGDWNRFGHRDSIAKFVGLVPSEHSSGQTRRLAKITKAGSTHARRLLAEAALHYRLAPAVGGKLAIRQRGQDPALIDQAWRVQRRLHARWKLLREGRGKPAGIVTIAIARELVGACWEIATA